MEAETPVKKKTKKTKAAAADAESGEVQENGVQENGVEQNAAEETNDESEGINLTGKLPDPHPGMSPEDVAIQIAMLMSQNAEMLASTPQATHSLAELVAVSTNRGPALQKMEENAKETLKAAEREEKKRKELEKVHEKLMQEKQDLIATINGEKGSLQELQGKTDKLSIQKQALENQLRVS